MLTGKWGEVKELRSKIEQESREKPIPLSEREQKYEYDKMKAIYALRNQDLDREVIGHLPDSSDRGNDGANY
jgi:hypothetical protein